MDIYILVLLIGSVGFFFFVISGLHMYNIPRLMNKIKDLQLIYSIKKHSFHKNISVASFSFNVKDKNTLDLIYSKESNSLLFDNQIIFVGQEPLTIDFAFESSGLLIYIENSQGDFIEMFFDLFLEKYIVISPEKDQEVQIILDNIEFSLKKCLAELIYEDSSIRTF